MVYKSTTRQGAPQLEFTTHWLSPALLRLGHPPESFWSIIVDAFAELVDYLLAPTVTTVGGDVASGPTNEENGGTGNITDARI